MNNSNLVELMAQTKQYEAHRKKIAQIMSSCSTTKTKMGSFDNQRIKNINTFYNNRDRATKYSLKSKQDAMEKENDLILKKIIQVNNRKTSSFAGRHQSITHNSMTNLKRSTRNINMENQKIAQKLVSTNSELRQQKLFESFRKHLQRKERIKKYEFDDEVGLIIPKKIRSLQKLMTLDPTRRSRLSEDENQQK